MEIQDLAYSFLILEQAERKTRLLSRRRRPSSVWCKISTVVGCSKNVNQAKLAIVKHYILSHLPTM